MPNGVEGWTVVRDTDTRVWFPMAAEKNNINNVKFAPLLNFVFIIIQKLFDSIES